MSNTRPSTGFVVGDKQPPRDHGLILDGILFMQEELGIVSAEVPRTYAGAKYLYEELIAKVKPPSRRQVALINRLASEVGGTVSGKLHSRRHSALLIKELYKVRRKMRANAGLAGNWLGPAVFAVVAGILLCLVLWPETTAGLFLLVPIIALALFGVYEVSKGRMDWWGNPKPGSPLYDPPRPIQRPPTARQLNFIDDLIAERDADDWVLEPDPQTIEEASSIIDHLLTLPYGGSLNKDDD